MLQQLREQKINTGLLSNISVFAADLIKRQTKLFDYIDFSLLSYGAGLIKPDPRIFNRMLKIIKCDLESAIMIGDSIIDDITPAKELGIKAIHFTDYKQLRKDLAFYKVFIE